VNKADLVSIIRAHRDNSLGVEDGELSTERAKALDHYHGRPYGNEVEGRSQVVSRDLAEAVDWAMPGIMRVFLQAGTLAEFDPIGPEDEQIAQQESDYVNQVMMRDNPGFMVLHDAVKDTLLLKNGYVKHWWDVQEKISDETYTGLTVDQITMMMARLQQQGAEVDVKEAESQTGFMPALVPGATGVQPIELWDVKLSIKRKTGKVIWIAVPTEEVRVSKKCRGSLQESPFTEHVTRKTRSDLIEMGMSKDFVNSLPSLNETRNSSQSFARDSVDDESDDTGQNTGDRSMDEIEYCEAYLKVDWDGDGVAELRKVVTCADQIPPGDEWNEPIPAVPLTGFVAKRVPHRHVGESLDDELADLQEIMTVLKRQLLDNIYLNNNSEMVVDSEVVNIRDFMTRTPGGIKRVKGPVQNAVMPLVTKPIIGDILPVIDHFEAAKETRSGISKATTGLDPDILQQTTKGAFMENLNRASQKMEMIARMLAETGVKESVLQVHSLLIRHQDSERMVQLRGKWTPINPQQWKERTDLTVKVGLGTGSEDDKRQKLGMLSTLQQQLMQALAGAPQVVYAKMYALFEDVAKTLGADMPEKYAVAPNSPEHQQLIQERQQAQQQQQQSGELAAAAKIQAEADIQVQGAKLQANMQVEAAEQQFKREKEQLQAQLKAQKDQADRQLEIVLERMRLESHERVEAMKQEVILLVKGREMDLGQPGISAGVQGAPGVPLPGMHQMPDGSVMPDSMMQNPPAEGEGMGA
jgi:hypothetical protein